MGEARISKRLECFLFSDDFASGAENFRQWVGTSSVSDHSPIILELKGSFTKPTSPFKLNDGWLKEGTIISWWLTIIT